MTPTQPDLLRDLNTEQAAAVTHTAGPLLVIAGAGTGKTSVITRRIAWLIQQKIAKPDQILALTFTDKAAGEMETRVDQLVPYGYTSTTIATFHSFGDQLLREYALDLGLPPEFRVLASDEQEIFLRERFDVIEDIELLRPIKNPEKFISHILRTISRAKDELVTPDMYTETAQALLAEAQDEEEKIEAQRQQEIAKIYTAYEDFKTDAGVIDFGDQILLLYKFLSNHPKILSRLQNQYRYILVDEFQDTNAAQYALIRLLTNKEQNLTVVGDDDQAIYKFRGAAVSNILGFLKDFPKAKQVVLTQNYRSTQQILNTSYQLIRHNDPNRLETQLNIIKKLKGQSEGAPVQFAWYLHESDELAGLIEEIQKLQNDQALRDIAILVRSNTSVATIASALTRADIPFTTSSDRNFTNLPEVRGIIAFFQVLIHPTDALAYMKLAFSPFYNLEPNWILRINDASKRTHTDPDQILRNTSHEIWENFDPKGRSSLQELSTDIDRYREMIGEKNPGEILYQFLHDRGILDRPSQKNTDTTEQLPEEKHLEMIQNIAAVFEAIKRYGDAGRDPFVPRFVDQLDELLANIIPPTVDLGPDIDAIRIMTVHAAKGLEFKTVFLPSLTNDRFPARRKTTPLDLPTRLIQETLPTGDEHLEEERRLAYVACTRAKEQLFLSGAATVGNGVRTKKISPFVTEALGLQHIPTPIEKVASTARIHQFAPYTAAPRTITLPTIDGLYRLTPAMIESYQNDPYEFYWNYVLKAPTPPSRHLNYGNAIHAAIETFYHQKLTNQPVTLTDLLTRYSAAWVGEGYNSKADEERQFAHGKLTLKRFFERASQQPIPGEVEQSFTLNLPGARITGRMDAVFPKIGEIRDFKTSDAKDQKDANRRAKENIPIRIYALAFQKRFGMLPKRIVLDFVEKDLEAEIQPTDKMLEETLELIANTVAGIKAHQFEPNPSNQFRDYE